MNKSATARARNWTIFRLRGLYNQIPNTGSYHLAAAKICIDNALEELGAEKESDRIARYDQISMSGGTPPERSAHPFRRKSRDEGSGFGTGEDGSSKDGMFDLVRGDFPR